VVELHIRLEPFVGGIAQSTWGVRRVKWELEFFPLGKKSSLQQIVVYLYYQQVEKLAETSTTIKVAIRSNEMNTENEDVYGPSLAVWDIPTLVEVNHQPKAPNVSASAGAKVEPKVVAPVRKGEKPNSNLKPVALGNCGSSKQQKPKKEGKRKRDRKKKGVEKSQSKGGKSKSGPVAPVSKSEPKVSPASSVNAEVGSAVGLSEKQEALSEVAAEGEPKALAPVNAGRAHGDPKACHNCGQAGHLQRNCPEPRRKGANWKANPPQPVVVNNNFPPPALAQAKAIPIPEEEVPLIDMDEHNRRVRLGNTAVFWHTMSNRPSFVSWFSLLCLVFWVLFRSIVVPFKCSYGLLTKTVSLFFSGSVKKVMKRLAFSFFFWNLIFVTYVFKVEIRVYFHLILNLIWLVVLFFHLFLPVLFSILYFLFTKYKVLTITNAFEHTFVINPDMRADLSAVMQLRHPDPLMASFTITVTRVLSEGAPEFVEYLRFLLDEVVDELFAGYEFYSGTFQFSYELAVQITAGQNLLTSSLLDAARLRIEQGASRTHSVNVDRDRNMIQGIVANTAEYAVQVFLDRRRQTGVLLNL